ncbi:MAG: hypothetical protein OXC44_03250 [Proteobacteria bacterium]|nr:hypothetical protein [Pseudomonadota bacterium]
MQPPQHNCTKQAGHGSRDNDQNYQSMDSYTAARLAHMMNQKYAAYLKNRYFTVELLSSTNITPHPLTHNHNTTGEQIAKVIVTLSSLDESYMYPIHALMVINDQSSPQPITSLRKAHYLLLDYVDMYFDEFFSQSEDIYLTLDYSKHNFEDQELYLKGQPYNKRIEKLADQWLDSAAPISES